MDCNVQSIYGTLSSRSLTLFSTDDDILFVAGITVGGDKIVTHIDEFVDAVEVKVLFPVPPPSWSALIPDSQGKRTLFLPGITTMSVDCPPALWQSAQARRYCEIHICKQLQPLRRTRY